MLSSDHCIFFSNKNFTLGDKLRGYFRKLNIDLKYCDNASELLSIIFSNNNYIIFCDATYRQYAKLIAEACKSNIDAFSRVKFIFIDDDLAYYKFYTNQKNFFAIPETNVAPALYNIITLCDRLSSSSKHNIDCKIVNKLVSDELCELGFSYKLIGFRYIKQCMEQVAKNNFVLGSLYKDVYSQIAINNTTTIMCIERAIRNSISKAAQTDSFNQALNPNNNQGTISNRFFLEYLADKISLKIDN